MEAPPLPPPTREDAHPAPPLDPTSDPRLVALVARHAELAGLKASAAALDREPPAQGPAGEERSARSRALEAQLDAAEQALGNARRELIDALRADAGLAEAVYARLLEAPATETRLLAHALRYAPGAELAARLAEQARSAPAPHLREAALVALEGRAPEHWLGATREAFLNDPDPDVRDRAAELFARALGNPSQGSQHEPVRAALLAGLADPEPKSRRRAVRAFLLDASRPDAVRERLTSLVASDPSALVRTEADFVLRAWAKGSAR